MRRDEGWPRQGEERGIVVSEQEHRLQMGPSTEEEEECNADGQSSERLRLPCALTGLLGRRKSEYLAAPAGDEILHHPLRVREKEEGGGGRHGEAREQGCEPRERERAFARHRLLLFWRAEGKGRSGRSACKMICSAGGSSIHQEQRGRCSLAHLRSRLEACLELLVERVRLGKRRDGFGGGKGRVSRGLKVDRWDGQTNPSIRVR